jgi:hypothetical protein
MIPTRTRQHNFLRGRPVIPMLSIPMHIQWIFMLVILINSVSTVKSQVQQRFDFESQLPQNTIGFIYVPDCRQLLLDLADTGMANTLDQTPFGKVFGDATRELAELSPEEALTGTRLLTELAELFDGSLLFAIFPITDQADEAESRFDFSYICQVQFDEEHPLIQSLVRSLENGNLPGERVESDQQSHGLAKDQQWKVNDRFYLGWRAGRLTLASAERYVADNFLETQDDKRSLGVRRKWVRIRDKLEWDSASVLGYIDTHWLIEKWIRSSPDARNARLILGETGVSETLAAGWTLHFDSENLNVDWRLNGYILASLPRKGIWSALSMKPLSRLDIPDCPQEAGYAFLGNSDLACLVEALDQWEQMAKDQYGWQGDEFLSKIANFAPPLLFPYVFRNQVTELFDGEYFAFGETQQGNNWWRNKISVGVRLKPGTEAAAEQLIAGLFPPDDRPIVESRGADRWFLQGDQSWQSIIDRMNELEPEWDKEQLGRVAFIFTGGRIIRFDSESSLERSLIAVNEPDQAIAANKNFVAVTQHIMNVNSNQNPGLIFFAESREIWNWPKFKWYGAGARNDIGVYQYQLDNPNIYGQDWTTPIKRAYLANKPDPDVLDSWGQDQGPLGGGVWDDESGFQWTIFSLRHNEK